MSWGANWLSKHNTTNLEEADGQSQQPKPIWRDLSSTKGKTIKIKDKLKDKTKEWFSYIKGLPQFVREAQVLIQMLKNSLFDWLGPKWFGRGSLRSSVKAFAFPLLWAWSSSAHLCSSMWTINWYMSWASFSVKDFLRFEFMESPTLKVRTATSSKSSSISLKEFPVPIRVGFQGLSLPHSCRKQGILRTLL